MSELRPFVKTFIENNIDSINNNDWSKVIDRWWAEAHYWYMDYDDTLFDQFAAVMTHVCDVDFLTDAKQERHDMIKTALEDYVDSHLERYKPSAGTKYKKAMFTDMLPSALGFTQKELDEICDEAAYVYDLVITPEYYFVKRQL